MKKLICIASCALFALQISAAAPRTIEPYGLSKSNGKMELNIPDPTRFIVELTLEHESLEVGEFARYAQKYLGMRAPLVSKNETKIVAAQITTADELQKACEMEQVTQSWVNPLPINIASRRILPQEEAAENAAEEILSIRERRRALIYGEVGEQASAITDAKALIDELNRQEQLYVELFMGRSSKSRSTTRLEVMLDGDEKRYIIGRFSTEKGILDDSDISGEPIMLQLKPLKERKINAPILEPKVQVVEFIVANPVECQLFLGAKQLSSTILPLFEFGSIVQYPAIK